MNSPVMDIMTLCLGFFNFVFERYAQHLLDLN